VIELAVNGAEDVNLDHDCIVFALASYARISRKIWCCRRCRQKKRSGSMRS
jgi:ribosomal protein L37AE/L43A